jgi:hydroxymethylpyrimidine/phosphomethylpyrimidine kinase
VLVTGGHGDGDEVVNRWRQRGDGVREWRWPRLPGEFHGSGCTLAAAIAARWRWATPMARRCRARPALCNHGAARCVFAVAAGQRIPRARTSGS